MPITYPLTIPSGLSVVSSSFRLLRQVPENESPFDFSQQTYEYEDAVRWEGEVTLKPMSYAQSAAIKAFLTRLHGKRGSFLYGDPDFLAKGLLGAGGGTPLVKGGSQTGYDLLTDGWPNNTLVLKAGDYIQLGSGSGAQLYMVGEDVTSDGSGNATISIEPGLRSSPADSAAITTTGAKGVFKLVDNIVEWNSDKTCITQITIAFKEKL